MSASSQSESIYHKTNIVNSELLSLVEGIRYSNRADQHLAVVEDTLDRFKLWAGNLGARHKPTEKISLDQRLLDAPQIRDQIYKHLDDLGEAIRDLTLFKLGSDDNFSTPTLTDDGPEQIDNVVDFDIEESPVDDVQVLLSVISEYIQFLFRIGVFVRRLAPVDKFRRALKRSDPIPAWAYVNYVKDKYSKLSRDDTAWLAERLGSASAKRKQFIKYCADHDTRLQSDYTDTATERLSSAATSLPLGIKSQSNKTPMDEQEEDDTLSLVTASTTFDKNSILRLPSLAALSPSDEPFTCPICRTIQTFRSEKTWKIHAFRDLQSYVCTVGESMCDEELFGDRQSWFDHELRYHRSCFNCSLCDEGDFFSSDAISSHITTVHGYLPDEERLEDLIEAGISMPTHLNAKDCPFCDEWAAYILSKTTPKDKPNLRKDDIVPVTVASFKRHVATHQEQLAIFVAREFTNEGEDEDENDQDSQDNPSGSDENKPTDIHLPGLSNIYSLMVDYEREKERREESYREQQKNAALNILRRANNREGKHNPIYEQARSMLENISLAEIHKTGVSSGHPDNWLEQAQKSSNPHHSEHNSADHLIAVSDSKNTGILSRSEADITSALRGDLALPSSADEGMHKETSEKANDRTRQGDGLGDAPGKRCPTCQGKGQEVWVLPGRDCPYCGAYII